MSAALSVHVADLVLWIALAEINPFATPADTMEFLRRYDVLQETTLAVTDLDYLLRHQSEDRAALALYGGPGGRRAGGSAGSHRKAQGRREKGSGLGRCRPQAEARDRDRHDRGRRGSGADKLGIVPLGDPTIADLPRDEVRWGRGVRRQPLPQLTGAFTAVAKAASVFATFRPTESEFAFLVGAASNYSWLDPSALPLAPVTASAFPSLERFLQALRLQRRKRARSRAFRHPRAMADEGAREYERRADGPRRPAGCDRRRLLDRFRHCLQRDDHILPGGRRDAHAHRSRVRRAPAVRTSAAARWSSLQRPRPLPTGPLRASHVPGAVRGGEVARRRSSIEDDLREKRRDALVAYLLAPDPQSGAGFTSVELIYGYYLLDPEMSACAVTTRLLQASLSIQQFVQRCYLSMEPPIVIPNDPNAPDYEGWKEWSWRGRFRIWEANRMVFLYPENYVLPELRKNKAQFFVEFENDLRQTNVDADSAEAALQRYLEKLVEVSRLNIAGHAQETRADGSQVLHVFGRTTASRPDTTIDSASLPRTACPPGRHGKS